MKIGTSFPEGGIYMDVLAHITARQAGQVSPYNDAYFSREQGARAKMLHQVINTWDRSQSRLAIERRPGAGRSRAQNARRYFSDVAYHRIVDVSDAQRTYVEDLVFDAASDLKIAPPPVFFYEELSPDEAKRALEDGEDLIPSPLDDGPMNGCYRRDHGDIGVDASLNDYAELSRVAFHEAHHAARPDSPHSDAYAYGDAAEERARNAPPAPAHVNVYAVPSIAYPSSRWVHVG